MVNWLLLKWFFTTVDCSVRAGDICMWLQHLCCSACVTSRPWGRFLTLNRNILSITFTVWTFLFIPVLPHSKKKKERTVWNFMRLNEQQKRFALPGSVSASVFLHSHCKMRKLQNMEMCRWMNLPYYDYSTISHKWFTAWNRHGSIKWTSFERSSRRHFHFLFACYETWFAYLPESLIVETFLVLGRSPEVPPKEEPFKEWHEEKLTSSSHTVNKIRPQVTPGC